jgi:hypothetical protein
MQVEFGVAFNSTLEFEPRRRHHFATREHACRAVATWIDEYNSDREHFTMPRGMTPMRRAAADSVDRAAQGDGPVPPASRVAATITARRACGPPLTPEPLTTQRHGQGQALPAHRAAHIPPTKIKFLPPSLYGLRELPNLITPEPRHPVTWRSPRRPPLHRNAHGQLSDPCRPTTSAP